MGLRSFRRRAQGPASTPTQQHDPWASHFQPDTLSVLDEDERKILDEVRKLTMISNERLLANMDAVRYVVQRGVPGAVVECGVWRGGSVLAMIKTLQLLGAADRDIYLYDTFEGMTKPGEADISPHEQPALATWDETPEGTTPWAWAFDEKVFGLEFVQNVIKESGYPSERVHFVQGPVEETIPGVVPEAIAVLRLDTDWYESTRQEMAHLYPRVSDGGVLIIDDWGHWLGSRRAVEEHFDTSGKPILLTRTDYSGRIGIKH